MSDEPSGGARTVAPLRLVYREDDAHFKRRLDSTIQFYWVLTYAVTIIACVAVFYALDLPLFAAIIAALLLLMVLTLQQTMSRIGRTGRWEVYGDHAMLPVDRRGGVVRLTYADIEEVRRVGGIGGERIDVVLRRGATLKYDAASQERALAALESAHKQWCARHAPVRTVEIPVVPTEGAGSPTAGPARGADAREDK